MKERLINIDIMRGLAIFTVVYSHLLLFCTEDYEQSGLTVFLRTFVLSGFFFLSGYMTKRVRTWNIKHTCEYIWRKFTTLFIPTLVCGGVYIWTHGISLQRAILDDAKYGYWFTFTLFMMCGFYAVTMYAICLFKCERKVWAILSAMALVSLVLSRTSLVHGVIQAAFSFSNFTLYLPFFIIGILCRRYSRIFNDKILGTSLGKLVVFIVVTLSYVIYVPSFLTQLAVVFLVYFIAKQLAPPLPADPKGLFAGCFATIGRNTLEIFLLHYFLLFQLPACVGNYLASLANGNGSLSFPELLLIGSVALTICFGCIMLSLILKQIPYINQIAFGKK